MCTPPAQDARRTVPIAARAEIAMVRDLPAD